MSTSRSTHDASRSPRGRPALMLALATVGFAVNFWAWALLSPLGAAVQGRCWHLSAFQQALLVAVPVIVGSLGRIPVGALTDRFGGRVMFPLVSLATIVPVLFLGLAGQRSLRRRCWSAASSSASPAPRSRSACRSSTPGSRRSGAGLAIGVFGAGMGGTAISALTTVKLVNGPRLGRPVPHHRRRARPSTPSWPRWCCATPPAGPCRPSRWRRRLARSRCGCRSPGRPAALYAVAFGGYVAFSRLPARLPQDRLRPRPRPTPRTGWPASSSLAVLMRPVGGWLSDRVGPVPVLTGAFAVVAVGAAVAGVHAAA